MAAASVCAAPSAVTLAIPDFCRTSALLCSFADGGLSFYDYHVSLPSSIWHRSGLAPLCGERILYWILAAVSSGCYWRCHWIRYEPLAINNGDAGIVASPCRMMCGDYPGRVSVLRATPINKRGALASLLLI